MTAAIASLGTSLTVSIVRSTVCLALGVWLGQEEEEEEKEDFQASGLRPFPVSCARENLNSDYRSSGHYDCNLQCVPYIKST